MTANCRFWNILTKKLIKLIVFLVSLRVIYMDKDTFILLYKAMVRPHSAGVRAGVAASVGWQVTL